VALATGPSPISPPFNDNTPEDTMTKYLALPLFAYAALASSSALADPAAASPAKAAYDRVIAHEPVEAVFASEARNDAWASTVESSLRKAVTSDLALLAPNAQVSSVVCQTTICQLQIKRTDADDADVQKVINMVPLARGTTRRPNVDGNAVFFLSFDDAMRSPIQYVNWYRTTRAKRLARLRSDPRLSVATPAAAKLPTQ
jgi:hypothetical protein